MIGFNFNPSSKYLKAQLPYCQGLLRVETAYEVMNKPFYGEYIKNCQRAVKESNCAIHLLLSVPLNPSGGDKRDYVPDRGVWGEMVVTYEKAIRQWLDAGVKLHSVGLFNEFFRDEINHTNKSDVYDICHYMRRYLLRTGVKFASPSIGSFHAYGEQQWTMTAAYYDLLNRLGVLREFKRFDYVPINVYAGSLEKLKQAMTVCKGRMSALTGKTVFFSEIGVTTGTKLERLEQGKAAAAAFKVPACLYTLNPEDVEHCLI